MRIEENVSLASFTTFKTGGNARYFVEISNEEELQVAVSFSKEKKLPIFPLGGGSNVLVSDAGFNGLVIHIDMKGMTFVTSSHNVVEIKVMAGEKWDTFVQYTVEKKLYGLENLSGIPGTVGAAPVQNIAAYGMEVKDTVVSVEAFDTEKNEIKVFNHDECQFSYRESFFKTEGGKKFVITSVTFALRKEGTPTTSYRDVLTYLTEHDIKTPTLTDMREIILEIRKNKLPSLQKYGTAGSFFKNIVVAKKECAFLQSKFKDLPCFSTENEKMKIPAAFVLDKICNLKGFRKGEVGLYERQALAVVNLGNATSYEIKLFVDFIIKTVKEKTGIILEPEVQFIGEFQKQN